MGFMVLVFLVPKFYELADIYWIGRISFEALSITEQYEFIGVSIEVVNETIPLGVLALVAMNYADRDKVLSILKAGIVLQLVFSVAFMTVLEAFTPQFVDTFETQPEIVDATTAYLRLKGLSLPFEAVAYLLLIGIKAMRRGKEALYIVTLAVVINMVLDLFLISDRPFSMELGIRGVALGYLVSKGILAVVSLVYLMRILGVDLAAVLRRIDLKRLARPIFRIGGWTGADSLTRNLGYVGTLMVLNMIGSDEFGGYGLAMWVMWTLIIPVLALAEGTAVVVGNHYGSGRFEEMRKALLSSLLLAMGFMLVLGLVGVLFWAPISHWFNPNEELAHFSVMTFEWLMIPYVLLAAGLILKSLFIGSGHTRYILFISLVANVGIIAPFVLLVKAGVIEATYTTVMAQFFIVFVEDLIVTVWFTNRLMRRISGSPLLAWKRG